jgi:hypothetical protein
MGELPTILAGSGVFGILGFVIIYLINGNRVDRKDYRAAEEASEKRVNNAMDEYRKAQSVIDDLRDKFRIKEDAYLQTIREKDRLIFDLQRGGAPGGNSP